MAQRVIPPARLDLDSHRTERLECFHRPDNVDIVASHERKSSSPIHKHILPERKILQRLDNLTVVASSNICITSMGTGGVWSW
jgi:hypothetical protein